MAKESTLRKVADFFEGNRRYDSADVPTSAPSMMKRKASAQDAPKGPFKTGPATGPRKKDPEIAVAKGRTPRY